MISTAYNYSMLQDNMNLVLITNTEKVDNNIYYQYHV